MPRTFLRSALCLVAVLAGACTSGGSAGPSPGPTATATGVAGFDPEDLPECQYPDSIPMPKWFPDDLPLPPGTYAAEKLSAVQGYRRTLLVVQRSLEDLQDFVFERFPEEGWIVGRGDTEPGEVDMQFSKAPAVGAFRALEQFCRPGFALVLVIYAPDREALVAPLPITPNPNSTPIG